MHPPPLRRRARPTLPAVALLLLLAWSAGGCRGTRPAVLPENRPALFPNHTPAQIHAAMRAASDTIVSYNGRASVRIESPDEKNSLSARVSQRASDSLVASVFVGPGIRVGQALVTPDSLFIYDRIKKRLYYNALSAVESLIPTPVEYEDLFRNLIGLLRPEPGPGWSVRADTSYYYLLAPSKRVFYTIDPRIWRTTRVTIIDENNDVIETRSFSEFDEFEGVYLPRRLVFERPMDEQVLSIYYRSLDLNPDRLELDFDGADARERILFSTE